MHTAANRSPRTGWRAVSVRLLALGVAVLVSLPASADRLVLTNGQSFAGRLVSRDEKRVVFEIHADGMILKRSYPASQVASIASGRLYGGTHYFVIPIRGRIGTDVTAAVLGRCLDIASDNLTGVVPDVVVLDIDSPGGDCGELVKMIQTLEKHPELRIVAYVRHADSAAAVLAMSRREIIMAPEGSIGGAVVYRITPEGTPENLEEKMQSFWRARFRAVAQNAGHNPLLVEGMMRTDIVLGMMTGGDRVRVVAGPGDEILKPKGRILTMSTAEAVKTRLAMGVSPDVGSCHRLLKLPEWRELMPRTAGRAFEAWRHEIDTARRQFRAATQGAVDLYNKAMAGHPNRGKYKVDPRTGEFIPESKTQWQQRTAACGRLLKQAESGLAQAGELAERFPQLRLPTDQVVELRAKCKQARRAVEADADRTGLPPPKPAKK